MYPNPTFYEKKYKVLRYLNLKLRVELRALRALPCLYTSSKMATRENSNDQKRKRKGALTDLPIKYQATTLDGIIPDIPGHENLPPLQLASYSAIPPNSLPKISFQQIYHHMILRRTVDGKEVHNYKGLDRAVKHFEAGDISQIVAAQVSKYIPDYKV